MGSIASCIVFFGQIARGAGIGALSTAASEIFTIIIFLLSLKYGFQNIRRSVTYCFIIALVGIIPWVLTKDPAISEVIAVSIDLIAHSSAVRRTWNEPKTETPTLYGMNVPCQEVLCTQPAERGVRVILDNFSTHKTSLVKCYLAQHPSVTLHFTPTYSSCLNQLESWFSRLQRDVIDPGRENDHRMSSGDRRS